MKFVRIPAGKFMMGSPEAEEGHSRNETQHEVVIERPFLIGMHEVRIRDFRRFVDETGYQTEAEQAGEKQTWKTELPEQTEEHPVVRVSWKDAQAFCSWLSKKESKKYRLPTDAEWEYACRAGTTTRFCNGDDADRLREVANVGYYTTMPVGSLQPNAFGLYDMHGNVYEWCQDRFEPGSDHRVIRGGGWDWCDTRLNCRSAFRGGWGPSTRLAYLGFRLACAGMAGK